MARETWGRWGSADQVGAQNLVGAPEIKAALELVVEYRPISLAQRIHKGMLVADHRMRFAHFLDRDGGDYAAGARRPGGFQFSEDTIVMPTHTGTHIDALCHVWYDDLLYNGHEASTIRSTSGAEYCSVAEIGPFVTRGVLLDFGREGSALQAGDAITAEMLEQEYDRIETAPHSGDAVLIRTGWIDAGHADAQEYFAGEPGLNVSAAIWLAQHDVALVGADNYAVEVIPFDDGSVFPVHQRLIRDFGVPLLEGLELAELSAADRTTFAFSVAPLPLQGATGSPVHPFALL